MHQTTGNGSPRQRLGCRGRRMLILIAAVLVLVCSSHALAAAPNPAGSGPSPSPEPVVEQPIDQPIFSPSPVAGYTSEQIREFQLTHGLIATGIADDYTLAAMDQAYSEGSGD